MGGVGNRRTEEQKNRRTEEQKNRRISNVEGRANGRTVEQKDVECRRGVKWLIYSVEGGM